MNIIIRDTNASKTFIEQATMKWQLYLKKIYLAVFVSYIFGVLFFILGIIDYNELYGVNNNGQKLATSWPFAQGIGLTIIGLATYFLIFVLFVRRKKYFTSADEIAKKLLNATNEVTIKIDNNSVEYQSDVIEEKIKWNVFKSFTIYKDYIFLNLSDDTSSSVIIDKRMIDYNDFVALNGFLKKQLIYKN